MNTIRTDNDLYETLGLARELESQRNDALQLEDFLDLMVTELTHQDPFKPMDNSELATQISQFATVSGINQLNDSFAGLSSSLLSDQALKATGLVGRNVLVPTDSGYLANGESVKGVLGLDAPASNLTLSVYDSAGTHVRDISLGMHPAGEVDFSWDGLMDNGEYAPPGLYRVTAQAMVDDRPVAPYLLMEGRVDSVSIGTPGQGLALNLQGLGLMSFDDVAEIR